MQLHDRTEAGRMLGEVLARRYAGREDVIVLALPRGGVPVAYEVARRLHAPLDVFVVRKLGVPGHEELAMGAIASGGALILNDEVIKALRVPQEEIDRVADNERAELVRREREYRDDRPAPGLDGRTVILIDDGLATGASMMAAVRAIEAQKPRTLVVAVPVAAPQTYAEFQRQVDEMVCLMLPEPFYAVSAWYEDFSQTTDEEVRDLLARAAHEDAVLHEA